METYGEYALRVLAERGELNEAFLREALQRANAQLSGPGRSSIPLPIEIAFTIEEANKVTRQSAANGGVPICGAQPPGEIAGDAAYCKIPAGHTEKIKHRDPDTGYSWWGEK